MTLGHRIVARDLGNLLLIAGFVALVVIPFSVAHGEFDGVVAMAITTTVAFGIGFPLSRIRVEKEPRQRHAMVIAALGWIVIPAVSAIPFVLMGALPALDAFFETMSGWTGTGFTLTKPSTLPATLQWWRSLIQWFGGVGVIVLTLFILSRPGVGSYTLYNSEGREDKIRPNVLSTVRTIWGIYVLLTVISIAVLFGAGAPFYLAVHHALTSIATGGFSTFDSSAAGFDNVWIETALFAPMILGAIAFVAHYQLLRGRWRVFFADLQVRALLVGLLIGGVALYLALRGTYGSWEETLRVTSFQWVSALTTTGFQTVNPRAWPDTAKMILALAMISGAAAGSTAGGIKLFRAALLLKGIAWKIERTNHPRGAVSAFRYGTARLLNTEANREFAEAAFVTFLWSIGLFASLFVTLHYMPPGFSLGDAFLEVASVQGNNGISTGLVSASNPEPLKLSFIFSMWAGRLEIFPVLILLRNALLRRGPFS